MDIKTQNIIASAILFVLVSALVLILGFLICPVNIIELEQPYKVLNENHTVKRGDKLIYEVNYIKHYDTSAVVYRNIICDDGNLVTLAPFHSNVPAGDHTIIRADVVIPEKTSISHCYMEVVLDYEWHPLRHINYSFETETFIVTE